MHLLASYSQLGVRRERKPQLSGWLELDNDAFYQISSVVFQCMEHY
jgi:hypothetical protein